METFVQPIQTLEGKPYCLQYMEAETEGNVASQGQSWISLEGVLISKPMPMPCTGTHFLRVSGAIRAGRQCSA